MFVESKRILDECLVSSDKNQLDLAGERERVLGKLNAKIIGVVNSGDCDKLLSENRVDVGFVFEAYYYLFRIHFSQRVRIKRVLESLKIYNDLTFSVVSYLFICFKLIFKILISFKGLFYNYIFLKTKDKSLKFDLAIGFPIHAFEYSEKYYSSSSCSSFGEYWILQNKDSKKALISADEYKRHSLTASAEKESGRSLKRTKIKKNFSLTSGILRTRIVLFETAKYTVKFIWRSQEIAIGLYVLFCHVKNFSISDFLDEHILIVDRIYRLPFTEDGGLMHKLKFKEKMYNFHYSSNFSEFPCRNNFKGYSKLSKYQVGDTELGQVTIGSWALFGNGVGFTDVCEYFFSVYANALNRELIVPDYYYIPLALGYEVREPIQFDKKSQYIAVFDNSPETLDENFSLHLVGDIQSNINYLEEWLSDILELATKYEYRVLLKPKYSLSNYSSDYQNMIKDFSKRYSENIIVVDPYVSIREMLKGVDLSISVPMTSVKKLTQAHIPSKYYTPFSGYSEYNNSYGILDVLYGKQELDCFLRQSRKDGRQECRLIARQE